MTALPKLSIRLHGGQEARDCLAMAQTADQAGLAGVWFAENPFARGILPAASLCAAQTERIGIGVGVFNPYNRHPALMAMEIGAIDELSGGRVSLGLGAGVAGAVEKMGFSYDKPLVIVREAVTILRALLGGGTAQHEGRMASAKGIKLDFATRPDLPIFVAGRGEQTLKFIGAAADGWIVSNMCTPGFVQETGALVHAAARDAGRPALPGIVRYAPCAVSEDRTAAHRAAKHAIAEMLPGFVALGKRVATVKAGLITGTGIADHEFDAAAERLKAKEDPERVLDDRFVAAYALAGTPDDCIAQARAQRAAGITELALTFVGARKHEEMRLLAQAMR